MGRYYLLKYFYKEVLNITTIVKTKSDIVETESGKIQGYSSDNLQVFKGIPYAASPVGPLRFSPPTPMETWSDVLDCTNFGPYVIQGPSALDMFLGKPRPQSEENCLTLNVWTPATDDTKRPTLFWIHGGAFLNGGAPLELYDGSHLAQRGNVVVVTINYRLGALGFLYVPGKIANAGLLDQVAALKWVKNNIAAFGGDPDNVTIFGESAGGMSVCTLLGMPAAKGLFHRAIAQSGACHPIMYDEPGGIKSTERLMSDLNIKTGDIEALRKVPVRKIIKAQNKITAPRILTEFLPFSPRIDKDTLPKHPLNAIRAGSAKDIELLIGTNLDEMKLYSALDPALGEMDDNGLYKIINSIMSYIGQDGQKTRQLIKIYKEAREGKYSTSPPELMAAIGTDFVFRIAAIRLSEIYLAHQANVYNYLFTWPSPALDGRIGSCHALEIPFVFGSVNVPKMGMFIGKGPDINTISEKMMDSWIAFAKTGNPSHDRIPKWPSYDIKKRATMLIGSEFKVVEAIFDKERAAWDGIF